MKDDKVLLLQRKNTHGEESWCFPGGHLELNEKWEQCATRETLEESGVQIKNIVFVGVTNNIFEQEQKHYVTLFFRADWNGGDACITEPEKCARIGWFDWDALPQPLFLSTGNLVRRGYHPFLKNTTLNNQ